MSQSKNIPQYDASHYAVVDLGSNSFHLLITQIVRSPTETTLVKVNKVKQKIRLAAGLDNDNNLTDEAIIRGVDCLKNFALYLSSIPKENILIVGTAALRIAKNNNAFLEAANKVLPIDIKLLSGEQEAETIYAGVNYAAKAESQLINTKLLAIDIGGASTEIIVGTGSIANKVVSLDIGCVSFIGKYFPDGLLSEHNFSQCIVAAEQVIDTVKDEFIQFGWQQAVSRSGTMQALLEILKQQNKEAVITHDFLMAIKEQLIQCEIIDNIALDGLREDRKAVLASGLSILIALFQSLNILNLTPSQGALREGLLFELLPDARLV